MSPMPGTFVISLHYKGASTSAWLLKSAFGLQSVFRAKPRIAGT